MKTNLKCEICCTALTSKIELAFILCFECNRKELQKAKEYETLKERIGILEDELAVKEKLIKYFIENQKAIEMGREAYKKGFDLKNDNPFSQSNDNEANSFLNWEIGWIEGSLYYSRDIITELFIELETIKDIAYGYGYKEIGDKLNSVIESFVKHDLLNTDFLK